MDGFCEKKPEIEITPEMVSAARDPIVGELWHDVITSDAVYQAIEAALVAGGYRRKIDMPKPAKSMYSIEFLPNGNIWFREPPQ